jgi:hypothetical protein
VAGTPTTAGYNRKRQVWCNNTLDGVLLFLVIPGLQAPAKTPTTTLLFDIRTAFNFEEEEEQLYKKTKN